MYDNLNHPNGIKRKALKILKPNINTGVYWIIICNQVSLI